MRGVRWTIGCILLVAAASTAEAGNRAQLSALERQALQSHDFGAAKDDTFGAVMTVLQDAGYRIQTGDLNTGLITAVGSSKARLSFNIWRLGFGRNRQTALVSAFIERRGVGSRVRFNFVVAKSKSSLYGSQAADEQAILDPAVYRDAFEKVAQALVMRQAINSPAADASVAMSPAPSSPPVTDMNR